MNLRVGLIRGLLDSPSIIGYGDQIIRALHEYYPEIDVTEATAPSPSALPIGRVGRGIATQAVRYLWFPLQVGRVRSDVNHVIDDVHTYLAAYLQPNRTIVTCHDLTKFVHPDNITSASLFPFITSKLFEHSLNWLHKAARVIAVSENTKKDILTYSQCTPEQVHVIYHGVDEVFQKSTDAESVLAFRRKFAPDGTHLLLHVGLTQPYKNIETVLRVLHTLTRDMAQKVRLIKVGQEFTASQRQLIRDLGLAGHIVHVGRLDRSELVLSYQSCDVLLFPSFYEGFGWPPLEAMSCGTPVVASNTGSIPEIVGDAAILEEPTAVARLAHAVASLFSNGQLRSSLIAAGLRRAKLFTWQRSVSQLVEVYKEVARLPHSAD